MEKNVLWHWLILTILFTTACGVEEEDATPPPQNNGDGTACFQLVNGEATTRYKSVVMLLGKESHCTGTFIAHNTLISASHCFTKTRTGGMRYVKGNEFAVADLNEAYLDGVSPLRVYQEGPSYGESREAEAGEIDLAVAIFPNDTAPDEVSFSDRRTRDKEKIYLVGFGITKVTSEPDGDGCDSYRRRVGTNKVRVFSGQTKGLYYAGRADSYPESGNTGDAINAAGDSGGPVFVASKLAGVVSSSGRLGENNEQGQELGQSYAVDLLNSDSQEFLDSVLESENITAFGD